MKPARKVRPDAVLQHLPLERQAEIIAHLDKHSIKDTRKWLADDGIQTSGTALSLFPSWYHLQEQFRQDEQTTDGLLEQLKKEIPGLTEEELDVLGQRTFSLLSIRNQDLDGFVSVRSARSKAELERAKLDLRKTAEKRMQEALNLQREKFQRESVALYLKWFADKEATSIASSNSTNAEKTERLGQKLFGELWK